MHREVPGGSAAHREATDRDPILVDLVARLDVGESLEGIDLARELGGVAVAAVGMQDEGVLGRELAGVFAVVVEKVDLAQQLASTVKPDVEPVAERPLGLPRIGHDKAVGLDRAVDF